MMTWTLVTGGSKRLGAAICLALAAQGHSVLVHYRKSKEDAEVTAAECRKYGVLAETIAGDFSSFESTEKFIQECKERFPTVSNLVNNVGNYLVKPLENTTPQEWNLLFQTNVNAPFALCQAFLPTIKTAKGSVVNLGVVGINHLHADVKRTAYVATKMSLLMLTKSFARELASSHVCVNMVSPGYLENAVDLSEAKLPMNKPASLDEVTRVITFLLDEKNRYITGQNIEVGGGIGLLN